MTLEEASKIAIFYQDNLGKFPERVLAEAQGRADSFDEFVEEITEKVKLKEVLC